MNFYQQNCQQVFKKLKTSKQGLTSIQVTKSRQKHGANIINLKNKSLFRKIIEPLLDVFVFVLVVAGIISFYQGHLIDAIVIFVVVMINAIIQYVQTYSTEKILRELNKKDNQLVLVRRNNEVIKIPSQQLVVGDIIILNEGDKVPADGRIIKSDHLSVDESMLTGESLPISKNNHLVKTIKQIFDQTNMLFGGSFVVSGQVEAVITQVGMATEFGKIAEFGTSLNPISPIQKKINKLITKIITLVAIVMPIILMIMLWRGDQLVDSINFILATTVSVVPEGLSIAITVILAFSMKQMARQNALVRNLRAIETIGVINVIASDKTGTLTQNKLSIQQIFSLSKNNHMKEVMKRATASDQNQPYSDPLDKAIADFTIEQKLTGKINKILPFNQELALSGAVWQQKKQQILYIKGSPEQIINLSTLTKKQLERINQHLEQMAESGQRIIGLASAEVGSEFKDWPDLEKIKFDFQGLIGLSDTIRVEAKKAVKQAQTAGVKVVMITGDHYKTAFSIAQQLGIADNLNQVLDMSQIERMNQAELEQKVLSSTVFARVTPERKFKILEEL